MEKEYCFFSIVRLDGSWCNSSLRTFLMTVSPFFSHGSILPSLSLSCTLAAARNPAPRYYNFLSILSWCPHLLIRRRLYFPYLIHYTLVDKALQSDRLIETSLVIGL